MPPGSIVADLTRQVENNSYGVLAYYSDLRFTCVDCGAKQTWTAKQQQWWYETAKGYIDSTAKRCRSCRAKRREERAENRRRSLSGRGT